GGKGRRYGVRPKTGELPRRRGARPPAVGLFVNLRLDFLPETAGAGAVGTAGLRHEAIDDTMKRHAIVEAVAHQLLDARDMAGGKIRPHQNDDLALGSLQRQRILGIAHGMFPACLSFRLSMSRMVNGRPAIAFPSASVNGKGAQRLSILATAMRYANRSSSDAPTDSKVILGWPKSSPLRRKLICTVICMPGRD